MDMFELLSPSYITVLILANFLVGFNNFLEIVLLDVYTNFDDEDPGQATRLMATIAFPKSLLLFYGLLSDNMALFGSHRKSWMILSLVCNVAVVMTAATLKQKLDTGSLTMLFIIQSVTVGFVDALTNGMIVQAANAKGIIDGAEKFQTLEMLVFSVGAVCGGTVAATLIRTEYIEPLQFLVSYAFLTVIVLVATLTLGSDSEPKIMYDTEGLEHPDSDME